MNPLPFDLDLYFDRMPGAKEIEVSLLSPAWNNEESTRRAWSYMSRAANGEIPKREPISVVRIDSGKFAILDGNSTFAVARVSHWPRIVALEFCSKAEFLDWKRTRCTVLRP